MQKMNNFGQDTHLKPLELRFQLNLQENMLILYLQYLIIFQYPQKITRFHSNILKFKHVNLTQDQKILNYLQTLAQKFNLHQVLFPYQ